MLAYILRRALQSLIVLIVVACLAFTFSHYAGDPLENLLSPEATVADRQLLIEQMNLDQPLPTQFARFLLHALNGDFGSSYYQHRPVADIIGERLPATLELAVVSTIASLAIGLSLGLLTSTRSTHPVAASILRFLSFTTLIGISIPTFLIGILLTWIFAVELEWLPAFGRGETVTIGIWSTGLLTCSGRLSLVLPALTLCLFQIAALTRFMSSELRSVLVADFIRAARARGLPPRRIFLGHALPNALPPVITLTSLQLGTVIAFATITETVFQWPGLGALFIDAIRMVDIPVITAYLTLVATVFIVLNLAADIMTACLDPRIREQVV